MFQSLCSSTHRGEVVTEQFPWQATIKNELEVPGPGEPSPGKGNSIYTKAQKEGSRSPSVFPGDMRQEGTLEVGPAHM
jgi:hypothetical protein